MATAAERPRREGDKPCWFVKVRVGNDYDYLGMVPARRQGQPWRLLHTKGSTLPKDDARFKAFAWTLRHLGPDCPIEIWHEGSCGACGRPLTDPESIAIGLGPICRGKVGS